MSRKWIPFTVVFLMAGACSPAPQATLPPPIPTHTVAIPTDTPVAPTETLFPTIAFSSTFTPIPQLSSEEIPILTDLYMMDQDHGWAIDTDGHILHSADGASTWRDVTPPQGGYSKKGFFALDGMTAWATSYCLGSSFGVDTPRAPFCDDSPHQNHTFIWMTHDGGDSWQSTELSLSFEGMATRAGSMYPEFIRFLDKDHGWLSISFGSLMNQDRYNLFHTEDGGETWQFLVSDNYGPGAALLTGLVPLDTQNIIVTSNNIHSAMDTNHDLNYHVSTDAGKTWDWTIDHIVFSPPEDPIGEPVWDTLRCGTMDIDIIPSPMLGFTQECIFKDESPGDHGFYAYRFIYFHSRDGGRTWNYWQQTGDVDFIDGLTGWQLVAAGENSHELQQTLDGGITWTTINTVQWDGILNFVDPQNGWALAYQGDQMAVVHTVDGGRTWGIKMQAPLTFTPCTLATWGSCDRY